MDLPEPVEPGPAPPIRSPFQHACDRCGTFAPLSSKYGPALCAECIERTAHPIVQTPAHTGDILRGVFQLLRAVGLPSVLVVTLAGLPMTIISYFLPELPFAVSGIWDFVVGTTSEMIVLHLAWQAITRRERRVSVTEALSAVGRRLGPLLGTRFLSNLMTVLFSLALIVPGVMKALSLTLAMPIALHEDGDPSAAMAASTQRMSGHRVVAFAAYCVTGAPYVAIFVWLMCIAMAQDLARAVDAPSASVGTTAFYGYVMLALGVLTPAAVLPVTLVPAVLYAKLGQLGRSSAS
jgi:hypothetical protein